MQIETTTVTTQTQQALGQNFVIRTYEQSVSAFCDCCDSQANGARETLENRGWFLGSQSQFCPECNY